MSIDVQQATDSTPAGGVGPATEQAPATTAGESSATEELLVEEISIDGMCGVY